MQNVNETQEEWKSPEAHLYGGHMANVKKSSSALITRAPVPSCYSHGMSHDNHTPVT